nr:LptF/LptG family permease [Pleurocapsa sp. PCC 7319]
MTVIYFAQGKISQIVTAKSATWNQEQQLWNLVAAEINHINPRIEDMVTENFGSLKLPLSATMFEIARKKRSPEEMNIRQAQEYLKIIKNNGKKTEITKFEVKIQQKYAFPFICLVFALVGSTLGAKYSQINRGKGFSLCVGIVFFYYLLGFASDSLGIVGVLSPWLAAWLPNILCLIGGIYLLVNVNR